jgi:hypothetical protein
VRREFYSFMYESNEDVTKCAPSGLIWSPDACEDAKFLVFTAVKIQVIVVWLLTPCSVVR